MIEIRSFRDLARLFFIFRREFKWAFAATVLVAVLGAFLLPARYESEARLLVKPGRDTSTLPIEYADRQTLVAPSTQRDPIVDEEKLLTGRPIIHQVADYYLNEMRSPPPQGWWKTFKYQAKQAAATVLDGVRDALALIGVVETQTPQERLAARLEKQFSVSHQSGSAVMEIAFSWDDPAVAQQVLAKWLSLYIDERSRALGRKSLYAFYETESGKLAEQIAGYKERIGQQLRQIDGISSKERLDSLTDQLNKLEAARSADQADWMAAQGGIANAQASGGKLPREITKERELSLNPAQQDLKLKLNGLELERLDKLKTYLPDAPPIRELDENIAALKALIAREKDTVQRSENRVPSDLVNLLERGKLERGMRAGELKAKVAAYDKAIAALKDERARILSVEPELSRLERNLAVAEKNYLLYRDSLEKARIDRELDNSRISNIAVIEQATFSPARVFPKSLAILLAAVPAGLAVGLFVLYLCYLLDQRIHDGGGVERRFGVPLWSTLMELEPGQTPPPAFEASVYRLYSQLPADKLARDGLVIGLVSSRRGEGVSFIAGQFLRVLAERGVPARLVAGDARVGPGEVALIEAPALLDNQQAFVQLKRADLILLVVEARASTVPVVENALAILGTAFGQVDGIVLNRRRFEIPAAVLKRAARWKGEGR
ncbi:MULTISPECIES: GumC family protein [Chromobacterium]|uniref:GumC family protein n=1 Tax=Chromobacterium TaxID=535 RepID=UPI001887BFD2|nr:MULTISPECIES: exopolysaccharide transport family protein [Chromobacterium]QOZ81941.1 lipopolysaccharide biosynthesis protein [Chromobacterium sp. Rain0013]WON81942.1 exopolysaccharide transport family protein [Chromobacterium haemolyticum]